MRRLLALALAVPLVVGCGSDQDDYCGAVEDHQAELTDIISSTRPDALLQAQGIFEDLRESAPDDIADEWQVLVGAVDGLGDAIRDAGADPETYDPDHPPEGVTQEQREAIATASTRLASPEVVEALRAVDQQVRDVCHTPLTL
ncbi:hypothetical protein GON03_01740 [Nocardioides sp. MAH-18]|uniref:Uncharacterized protein n=1 Tax=Nocardioides agri TaxID=2682843 RepID=A0A6L6XMT4_9ACTN|nr:MULTISPECIES: hypothetical protein [unclassified Nocardioides]MBA2953016.1 hypothetical protein [Nocardioides sp. CGMCC 1.13656]MVQ47886.1 hypothetical protein [Nocardioides sp. MAH-18]